MVDWWRDVASSRARSTTDYQSLGQAREPCLQLPAEGFAGQLVTRRKNPPAIAAESVPDKIRLLHKPTVRGHYPLWLASQFREPHGRDGCTALSCEPRPRLLQHSHDAVSNRQRAPPYEQGVPAI